MPTLNTVFYSFCCHTITVAMVTSWLYLVFWAFVSALCSTMPLIGSPAASVIYSYITGWGVAEWINEIVLYNVKHCFYLVGMVLGQHRYICLLLLPNTFFYNPLPPTFCILHNILFISVDELNDTIAANLSDTEFYGGELWWL